MSKYRFVNDTFQKWIFEHGVLLQIFVITNLKQADYILGISHIYKGILSIGKTALKKILRFTSIMET